MAKVGIGGEIVGIEEFRISVGLCTNDSI